MLVVVQTVKNVDLSSWRCQMAKNLIRMVKGRECGAKSGLKGRSKMLECELWALSLRQLGGVHKLRLQDEVGRWLSKCQQMLTEVGRWSVLCKR